MMSDKVRILLSILVKERLKMNLQVGFDVEFDNHSFSGYVIYESLCYCVTVKNE